MKRQADEQMLSLDYQGALDGYDRVYAITKDPALHYNRGRALAALQRFPEALAMVEAFEREATAELKGRVPKLDEFIGSIRERVATISVTTKNSVKASVSLDDRVIGTTPLSGLRVNAGKVTLRVQADGYDLHEQSLNLEGSKLQELLVALAPKDKRATLVVRSATVGASVTINGTDYGQVPVTAKLSPGSYQVGVDGADHYESERQVDLAIGDRREIDVPLEAMPAAYETWWFWTIIGGVTAAGVVTGSVLAATTESAPTSGTIDPGQIPIGASLPSGSGARSFSVRLGFPF